MKPEKKRNACTSVKQPKAVKKICMVSVMISMTFLFSVYKKR